MKITRDVNDNVIYELLISKILNYIQLCVSSHAIVIFINKRKHKAGGNGKIT